MKQTQFNPALELEKLQAETEQKKKQIALKADILDKLPGFNDDDLIVYSDNGVGFGWKTPINKEQVKQIFAVFPVTGDNYTMKFASSQKNFETDSPLVVKWENSHSYHFNKVFKICYESNGVFIQISVPPSHFSNNIYYKQFKGKHRGFGRYEMFNDIFIDYFYTQSYSGGYNTLYFLEGAESLREYENFIITGEFKYDNEV